MIRVFLVEDHELFASGVRNELGQEFALVGHAGSVAEAVAEIPKAKPDVVLLDVHLPDGNGPAGRRGAPRRALPRAQRLGRGRGRDRGDPRRRARLRDEVDLTPELADAIRRVHEGDAVFSPRLAGFVLDAFAGQTAPAIDPELDQLTPREKEVLRYIARGYAYKEIARELHISVKTVESHVGGVLRKLQLTNRYELSRWASERKLA